jgi:hypothetical protein
MLSSSRPEMHMVGWASARTGFASPSATTAARARQQDHLSNNFRGDGHSDHVLGRAGRAQLIGDLPCEQ